MILGPGACPDDLLPCPFCGGAPVETRRQDEDIWTHSIVWWLGVECRECDISFDMPETAIETAREQWNRRA